MLLAMSSMSWLFLIGFLLVIGYLIFNLATKKKSGTGTTVQAPVPDLSNMTIEDARTGDTISIEARGDEFEDLDFTVDRRNKYQSRSTWYEVTGLYRGRRVYVEFYNDDELEVYATLQSCDLTLADLGLTEEDLIRMDENQSRSEGFEFEGASFRYEDSCEIGYFQDSRGEGEGYYNWDFVEKDGDRLIFIEKWEDEPFEVGISVRVPPRDITVYRAS